MKKVLKYLLTTVFIVSMLAVCAFQSFAAETYEYVDADGNVYTYTQTTDGLYIHNVELKDYTHLVIPDTIDGSPVTRLDDEMFYNFDTRSHLKLTGVTIPGTVKIIGNYVFYNCRNLKNIVFGNLSDKTIRNTMFQDCKNLESVTFGNTKNVTIAANTFADLTKLKTVELGNPTGMEIKNYAFADTGITEITVPEGVSLGQYVFYLCPNLVKAEIYGSPLKQVETTKDSRTGKVISEKDVFSEYLFYKCPVLREVTIANYETIYESMFKECPALEKVNVGNATTIGRYAFLNCTSLKTFKSNGNVKIGHGSFEGCSAMEYFDFSKVIGLDWYSFRNCTSLKNVDLSNVSIIPESCFSGCTSLTELDLSGVTEKIWDSAFSGCTGLKELHIVNDIYIGAWAFRNCTGLEKIIVEDNVKYINLLEKTNYGNFFSDDIFEGCTNIKYIYIGASFLPNVVDDKHTYLASELFEFYLLDALEEIEVSPDNPYYRSVDNVLYLDEGDVYILLCYPRAKKGEYYSTEKALAGVSKDFTLGELAFCGNQYLKEVNFTKPVIYPDFQDDNKDYRYYYLLRGSFYDTSVEKVTFPKGGMKTVGDSMFESSAIRDIDLSGTERIKYSAFYDCQNLVEIDLLSCTDLGRYAFAYCESLKTVDLPLWTAETDGWSDRGWSFYNDWDANIFYKCTALESVNMPLAKRIPGSCFYGCTSLVNVNAPDYIKLEEYCFYGCTSLEKLDTTVDYVGRYAFEGCSNFKYITFDDASIREGAFKDCISLQSIDGVRSIGKFAFEGCTSLKNLKLYGVSSIGENAFKDCTSLYLAQFDNSKCTFGNKAFENCPTLSFYCDENSDAYNYAVKNNIPIIAVSVGFQNDQYSYEYTGSKVEPSIIVSISGMRLVQNKDYTLTFENNLKVGTATVTVHFIGDFEGLPDARRIFTIARRSIDSAEVEYVVDNEYTGEDIRPAVVVKLDGKILVEGVDYSITYSSGTDTGTMFFTINGIRNYIGTIECYYNIVRRDIAEATAEKIPDCFYTGDEICPIPTLTWNGFTLVYGEDYEMKYFENVNAGFGTAVVYGKGNFNGAMRLQFRIFGKGIENAVVSEIPDQVYDGNEKTPSITVTLDGVTLKEGTDYTVEYVNNTEKGTATVIIRGIGNYSGVTEKTFKIYKNSVYSFTVFSETQMTETYDGTPLKPEMEVYFGTEMLTEGVDYEIRLENNTNAGTATVTIIGIGRFEGERTYNFTILPCEISEKDISVSGSLEFNGAPVEPVITVTKNGTVLENGKDYIVTYHNNNGVGTAYVTVEGIGNYCSIVNLEYEIYKTDDDDGKNNEPEKPDTETPDNSDDENPSDDNKPSKDDKNENANSGSENNGNVNNGTENAENEPQTPSAEASSPSEDINTPSKENNGSVNPQIPNTDMASSETAVWFAVMLAILMSFGICDKTFRRKAEE
ncbi:MAG: leucine-rich repeat protein [Oscillospiraceae bacterium]|nr:leucine-rich repeat protein [Oscillospiraceae bacterium]